MTPNYKSVKIYPHESYFTSGFIIWKPLNGRSYVIHINNVFPQRAKVKIESAFAEKGFVNKVLSFNYFEYDRINKLLFLEENMSNTTPFIREGSKWRTP